MILDEQVLKDSCNFLGQYLAKTGFELETRYLMLPPGLPLFLLTAPLLSQAACHHPMIHGPFVFYDHAIRKLPPTAAARSNKVWGLGDYARTRVTMRSRGSVNIGKELGGNY